IASLAPQRNAGSRNAYFGFPPDAFQKPGGAAKREPVGPAVSLRSPQATCYLMMPLDFRYALATSFASLWSMPTCLLRSVRSAVVSLLLTLAASTFRSEARLRMSLRTIGAMLS